MLRCSYYPRPPRHSTVIKLRKQSPVNCLLSYLLSKYKSDLLLQPLFTLYSSWSLVPTLKKMELVSPQKLQSFLSGRLPKDIAILYHWLKMAKPRLFVAERLLQLII